MLKNKYIFEFDGELEKSIKIIRKYSKEFYELYNMYIEKEKNTKKYLEEKCILEEYRTKVLDILNNIVKSFHYFNNNAVIFLSGSFARNGVRLFSDIDLNIVYIRGDGSEYIKYEELFYYIVSNVFRLERKRVHSILTAYNDRDNIDYILSNWNDDDIKIILKDNKKEIIYNIPSLSKKRIYLQYINNKNYKKIFKNLVNIIESEGVFEWSNNFIILNYNKEFDTMYKEYIDYIYSKCSVDRCIDFYEKLLLYIDTDPIDINSNIKIKDLKNRIQMEEFHFIYNSVCLLQTLNICNNKDYKFINNYNELLRSKNKTISMIVKEFYKYNYDLIKLNDLLKEKNITLSIHTNDIIDLNNNGDIKKSLSVFDKKRVRLNKKIINLVTKEIEKMKEYSGTIKLETERLILRKFEKEDYVDFYKNVGSDSEVVKYVVWNLHKDEEVTKKAIEKWIESYTDTTYYWAIFSKEINEVIGSISCVRVDTKNKVCEIGYVLSSKVWGKGYATETLKKIIDFLMNHEDFNTVCGEHLSLNPASGKVMLKCGMKFEGTLKKRMIDKNSGEYDDLLSYAIYK